jgi:hypothetical protein
MRHDTECLEIVDLPRAVEIEATLTRIQAALRGDA